MRRSLITAALGLALAGCAGDDVQGPPNVRLGRDQCAECGMLLSDEACVSAAIVERDGRREYALFDDMGCLLDHRRKSGAEGRVAAEYVRDFGDKQWADGASAWYVVGDPGRVRTPMGSGVVAFATRARAEEACGRLGGRVVARSELKAPAPAEAGR